MDVIDTGNAYYVIGYLRLSRFRASPPNNLEKSTPALVLGYWLL